MFNEAGLRSAATLANNWLFSVFDEIERLKEDMDKTPRRWEHECIGWDDDRDWPIIVPRKEDGNG